MYRQNHAQSITAVLGVLMTLIGGAAMPARVAADEAALEQPPALPPDPDLGDNIDSEAVAPDDTSWVDESHGYMTDRANALTQWVDDFFGDREADADQAESRLRLRLIHDQDETRGNDFRVRVGGKVNLPKLSRRLDLVFQGDDPDDEIDGRQDPAQSRVGLQYQVGSQKPSDRGRFDLTLGLNSAGPRPGARYRFDGLIRDKVSVRFTQRVQYEFSDGAFATTRLDIDYPLDETSLIRSFSRVFWGERSEGMEWSTAVGHATRWSTLLGRERASFVYAGISGKTQPDPYEDNYFVGARYRMQAYRDYLFFEIEPSYNWRVDEAGFEREGAYKIELRLELLLDDSLRRDVRDR